MKKPDDLTKNHCSSEAAPDLWTVDLAALSARTLSGRSAPRFTVGDEVDLLNPPRWAPGSRRVTITRMTLQPDGSIQCGWVARDTSIGGAPETAFDPCPSEVTPTATCGCEKVDRCLRDLCLRCCYCDAAIEGRVPLHAPRPNEARLCQTPCCNNEVAAPYRFCIGCDSGEDPTENRPDEATPAAVLVSDLWDAIGATDRRGDVLAAVRGLMVRPTFAQGWNDAIDHCAEWLRDVEPLQPKGDTRDDVGFSHCDDLATELEKYKGAVPCLDKALVDELSPLRERLAKGREKYANGCTVLSLLDEAGEVAHALNKYEPSERVRDEILDVASVAMRLYLGEVDTGLTIDGLEQRRICPGCHAVAPDRCVPGCIDDEMAREREDGARYGDHDRGVDDDEKESLPAEVPRSDTPTVVARCTFVDGDRQCTREADHERADYRDGHTLGVRPETATSVDAPSVLAGSDSLFERCAIVSWLERQGLEWAAERVDAGEHLTSPTGSDSP